MELTGKTEDVRLACTHMQKEEVVPWVPRTSSVNLMVRCL